MEQIRELHGCSELRCFNLRRLTTYFVSYAVQSVALRRVVLIYNSVNFTGIVRFSEASCAAQINPVVCTHGCSELRCCKFLSLCSFRQFCGICELRCGELCQCNHECC
jgi:hypothetical protein